MTLGQNMKRLRDARKWTQKATAVKLGYEPSTYSRYESDDVLPNVMTLMQIANLFGVGLDELTGFVPDKENRLNSIDASLYRLEEMGADAEVEDDVVKFHLYGKRYVVNISDISTVVSRADDQYDKMLLDIKGLYNASLAVVLTNGKFDSAYVGRTIPSIKKWAEQYDGEITPDAVMSWLRKGLVLMSKSDRKQLWNHVVYVLTEEGLIPKDCCEKDDRWRCPFVD